MLFLLLTFTYTVFTPPLVFVIFLVLFMSIVMLIVIVIYSHRVIVIMIILIANVVVFMIIEVVVFIRRPECIPAHCSFHDLTVKKLLARLWLLLCLFGGD
jgi:hypothetical protein